MALHVHEAGAERLEDLTECETSEDDIDAAIERVLADPLECEVNPAITLETVADAKRVEAVTKLDSRDRKLSTVLGCDVACG